MRHVSKTDPEKLSTSTLLLVARSGSAMHPPSNQEVKQSHGEGGSRLLGVTSGGLMGQQSWALSLLGFKALGALDQICHDCGLGYAGLLLQSQTPSCSAPTKSWPHVPCILRFVLLNLVAPPDNFSNLPQKEVRVTH